MQLHIVSENFLRNFIMSLPVDLMWKMLALVLACYMFMWKMLALVLACYMFMLVEVCKRTVLLVS